MKPKITPVNFSYQRAETSIQVLNRTDIPINFKQIKEEQYVILGPGAVGGNHQHERIEWFIALGDLVFIWMDENGDKHEEEMKSDKGLLLFEVPPLLPHAVVNRSQDQKIVLYELANKKKTKAKKVLVNY